jgi:hypothetical protein
MKEEESMNFEKINTELNGAPFTVNLKGNVNDSDISIQGTGIVKKIGHYEALLNFSHLPKGFHPAAISTYTISICCYGAAAMRNGGLNIVSMGANGYKTVRKLFFENGGLITISGDVTIDRNNFTFAGSIEGQADLPDDLAGNSIYIKRIVPVKEHELHGVGEGSLFRQNGREIKVKIDTTHLLKYHGERLSNPLKNEQFRIVSESGTLLNRTYKTNAYSILDGATTLI